MPVPPSSVHNSEAYELCTAADGYRVVVDLAGRAFHSANPFYHRVRAITLPYPRLRRACGSAVGAASGAEGVTQRSTHLPEREAGVVVRAAWRRAVPALAVMPPVTACRCFRNARQTQPLPVVHACRELHTVTAAGPLQVHMHLAPVTTCCRA
jgi:hypothetical protein